MRKKGIFSAILLVLYIIYFLQDKVYAGGSIISQTLFLAIILSGCYYLLKCLPQRIIKNSFFKVWTLFLFINILGYLIGGDFFNPFHTALFKGTIFTLFAFFPFYYFTMKGVLDSRVLMIFIILMVPVTIWQYSINEMKMISMRLMDEEAEVVNNVAYTFTMFIPYAFLFKNNKMLALGLVLISMIFIVQGAKRGALITGTVGFLVFIYYQFKFVGTKHRIRNFLFLLLGLGIMVYYLLQLFETNEYFISRIVSLSEGNSSGRDIIYTKIFEGWLEGDFLQLVFGFGYGASAIFARKFAHSDWLELLSNFGLLGVITYLIVFIIGFRMVFSKNLEKHDKFLVLSLMLMWLLTSSFSMGYMSLENGFMRSMLLGYIAASASKKT